MNRKMIGTLFLVLLSLSTLALPGAVLAQGGGTLTYGQAVTGEITQDTPEVRYTFEGRAGEVISLSMTATQPGLDSYLELLGPDGQSLQTNDDSGGNLNSLLGPFRLPADGVYTVVATRFMRQEGTSVGPFELVLNSASLNPLSLDETITVVLTDAQPATYFSYAAAGGEMLSVEGEAQSPSTGGQGQFYIEVRDPSGMVIRSASDAPGMNVAMDPLVLNQAGEYLFALSRQAQSGLAASGEVSLRFIVRRIETQPIDLGQTVQGTLNDANPSDHYTFTGTAGDLARVEVTQGAGGAPVDVQVISVADGGYAGGNNTGNSPDGAIFIDPLQLNSTGAYLIVASRYNLGAPSASGLASDYTLTFGPSQVVVLQPGVAVDGSFSDPNVYEYVYRFDGTAGQTVRITLRSLGESYAASIDIQGPTDPMTGFQAFYASFSSATPGTFSYETALPTAGTYLFRVHNNAYGPMMGDGPSSTGGQYSLMVEVVQ